jgi:hypothetical protein
VNDTVDHITGFHLLVLLFLKEFHSTTNNYVRKILGTFVVKKVRKITTMKVVGWQFLS